MNSTDPAAKNSKKDMIKKIYIKYGIWMILIGMVILMTCLSDNFLSTKNILNLVRQVSFISIIGFGSALILICGGLDLSPGAIVAVTSVVSASFGRGEYPVIFAILIGLCVGLAAGIINGIFVTKLKVPPFIATLGMMTSAKGIAMLYTDGNSVNGLTDSYRIWGAGKLLGIPIPIIIMLILAVIMYILLEHTPYGRHVVAVGDNEQAAKISGIKTERIILSVYIIGGMLASVASILMSGRIASGQPLLGEGYEMDAISAAVVGGVSLKGGVGSIWGVVCGALIIGIINNGMNLLGVSSYWQQVVKGIIIVLAIVLDQLKHIND